MLNKNKRPNKILIVGGGTAGWMTASLLASRWQDCDISLVESKEVGIIGVGEGSTPHLKLFFDAINVPDSEWMPRCDATYKNGITFNKWSSKKGFESYYHPFAAQTDDIFTVPLFYKNIQARLQRYNVDAHPDNYFLETYLSQQNLGPLPAESFPFGVAYGYHFNSALLGEFLAEKFQAQGVTRHFGNVNEVLLKADGSINSVQLEDGRELEADFFIDCSGFNGLLIQKALKVNFQGFENNLFNDAAVVIPTEITKKIPVETKSTALKNGWAWKIPLQNRFGNGYVYSSAYISAEEAEQELRDHLGLTDNAIQAKHLKMKVGAVEKHWTKNCLAVGLSQGFIEPLEATALGLSFNTISQFMQAFQQGNGTNQYENAFNQDINARFDGVRDYIVCHYKVNQRNDSQYWLDNAANEDISENLKHIIHLWKNSADFEGDMNKYKLATSYQPKSWACLLAGYGFFPPLNKNDTSDYSGHHQEIEGLKDFIRRCGLNFKEHNDLLKS